MTFDEALQAATATPAGLIYLSILAHRQGLAVTYCRDSGEWEWRGTKEQFQATGHFKSGQSWTPKTGLWTCTTTGIRAYLYPSGDHAPAGELRLVHRRGYFHLGFSWKGIRILAEYARVDSGYQAFRASMLRPVAFEME